MNKFAERLNRTLRETNVPQRELARRVNMSQSIINNYCRGEREPTLDVLMLVCKALGESADYMLGMTDD